MRRFELQATFAVAIVLGANWSCRSHPATVRPRESFAGYMLPAHSNEFGH